MSISGGFGLQRPVINPLGLSISIFEKSPSTNFEAIFLPFKKWVPGYLDLLTINAKIEKLDAELNELHKRPRSRKDRIAELTRQFEMYKKKRIASLLKHLANPKSGGLLNLENPYSGVVLPPLPFSDSEFKKAVDFLPEPPNGIADEKRASMVQKLEAERKELEAKKAALSPKIYFDYTNDRRDCRALLVEHWREVQTKIYVACDIFGCDLKKAPKDEQDAHVSLGLGPYINRTSGNPPAE